MSNKNREERYNLPTIEDWFEKTNGSYIGRIEKIELNKILTIFFLLTILPFITN